MTRPFPLHTGVAGVAAIEPLTPGMLRFTLHHETFAEPGIEQPGEILTLGWPMNGEEELVLPQLGWRFPDGKPEQHWRSFTVRRFDPGRATIDVDIFLHGDLGQASAGRLRRTRRPPLDLTRRPPRRHDHRPRRRPAAAAAAARARPGLGRRRVTASFRRLTRFRRRQPRQSSAGGHIFHAPA